MNARALMVLGLAVLLVSACDEEGGADGGVDAGQLADSGLVDAGGSDGGSFDGGSADGGPTDGGSVDGGAVCGDGVVQAPEICDGDCPTDCNDDVACTADTLTGSAETCDAVCSFEPIELCQNGDGCCPSGCNATNDDDCSPTCGNGTLEPPEICDGDCPTECNDGNACTTDTLVGSAESCSAECSFVDITMCIDGDGCCPSGCDALSDDDCSGPIVSAVSPTSVAIGSPLQVTGAALGTATAVTLGGTSQTFTAAATVLEIAMVDDTTPLGAGQELVVTTPDGTTAPLSIDVLDRLAVLSASSVDDTTVEVTFSRELDATTVEAADFTIAGLTIDAATATGATVTLTTSTQAAGTTYTVMAADVTDSFGNELTGDDTATFTTAASLDPVNLTDFASGVTAASHPNGSGAYDTWYSAHQSGFSTVMMSTLEGMPGMRIADSGFANGVYAIFDSAVPATGDYQVEVRIHVVEVLEPDDDDPETPRHGFDGVRAYQVGVAIGAAAVHRDPNGNTMAMPPEPPTILAPLSTAGDYATMTTGDDTALGPITVTTPVFTASAGDDILIGLGTDVTSGGWTLNSAWWGNSYVLVGDVLLVPAP